jgi:hypothetical protein
MSNDGGRPEVFPLASGGSDGVYDGSGKSPQQIEEDINETRAQLGELLDELERKLAPRHLFERGVDMLKDSMSGDASAIGETLRGYPMPLALIGLGIGWMAISATTGRGKVGDATADVAPSHGAPEPYPVDAAGYAYAREKSGAAMATAWETAEAPDQRVAARRRFGALLADHPLAVGAVGFFAAALLALVLPRSGVEKRLIGETGDRIRARAADLGRAAAERAGQVAERAVDAAMGAVRETVSEVGDALTGKIDERRAPPR